LKISSDFLIVGAGIVGLTVAKELLSRYPKSSISILEKENDIGKHASGRNSGVMHSGVYYGSTTLKAKVCSLGAARMREFAAEYGIACQRVGKVIIATSADELQTLERLLVNAQNNGVNAERLDEQGIKQIEPAASPYEAGIYCPDTAVIDSNVVIQKLRGLLLQSGVKFYYDSLINSVTPREKLVVTRNGEFTYGFLYNCAGAGADIVAKKVRFCL
jgi:L-2-hydroxyglutarate oxidase LhgO